MAGQNFKGTVYYKSTKGGTEQLPFAQVYYLEAAKLLECDENGIFTLDIKDKATLIATYVGYSQDTVIATPETKTASFYLTGDNEVEEAVIMARQAGLSRLKPIKTEVITAAGLCKMACCSLAESFENSASVTVGYADAVTGARQIKLLGLSGIYNQMLDETRPVMRGIASPFGMSYIPGQWLESIQIAKGPSSVVNGYDAITGQINMEHRKPTDETPLFVNLYGSSDYMIEANIASAIQFNPKWSTILLAHYSGTLKSMDHNCDGFRDDPMSTQFNIANRWLYYDPSGLQFRFGFKAMQDDRLGGEMGYSKEMDHLTSDFWGSRIINRNIDGYLKIGYPLREDQSASIAAVFDGNIYTMDSYFGRADYDGAQKSFYANLLYQNSLNDTHSIEFGVTALTDNYSHLYTKGSDRFGREIRERSAGAFGQYTYTDDKWTLVAGLRADYDNLYKTIFSPRLTVKYSLTENLILRASGGKAFHTPTIMTDNMGILSTGRRIGSEVFDLFDIETAWTYGGNLSWYLPFGNGDNNFFSIEYFRNDFISQIVVDQEYDMSAITIYQTEGKSFTNTYQADLSIDPIERFNITLTYRYTDARVTLKDQGLVERPMNSRYKAVLNMQYATNLNKWTFDFTAQLNGPVKLPIFMDMQYSPVYPMLYGQITRKFRGLDIYAGVENITDYCQHDAILSADNPFGSGFNASVVWGPLMGRKFYAGLRYTIWK